MEEKLDLFDSLVRFLSIKPLSFEDFSLDEARSMVKEDRKASVAFIGEHSYFEEVVDSLAKKVKNLGGVNAGTVYINLHGKACTTRMKQNLLELTLMARKIYIFDKSENWELPDPKIEFVDKENIFEPNHQRFFVYLSPAYSVAIVARHSQRDGEEVIESLMTTAHDAVSLVGQQLGLKMYRSE